MRVVDPIRRETHLVKQVHLMCTSQLLLNLRKSKKLRKGNMGAKATTKRMMDTQRRRLKVMTKKRNPAASLILEKGLVGLELSAASPTMRKEMEIKNKVRISILHNKN
jgi:hypothetical protein